MAEFVAVGNVNDFQEGVVKTFIISGEMIAVIQVDGQFYAINNICSHEYAELHDGELDTEDCTLECPLHGSKFSLQNGEPLTPPAAMPIATYPVQIVGDEIQVAVS